jgi:hypothetical protein
MFSLSSKEDDYIVVFLLVVLSLSGIAILLYSTVWGAGLTPDSTVYIATARNLLKGNGLVMPSQNPQLMDTGYMVPLVGKQPLYPTLLAMIGVFGADPMIGARWLTAFLFGANIMLVGLVIYQWTRGSMWAALLGSLLMLTSPDMLRVHQSALTEPVFLFLSLLGLAGLSSYLESPKPSRLLASSIAVALALLARYTGVILVATGAFGLLVFNKHRFRRRVTDAAAFLLLSCFPAALWSVRNLSVAGTMTNRSLGFHPVPLYELQRGLYHLSLWVIPNVFPWTYQAMAGAMVFVIIVGTLVAEKIIVSKVQKNLPGEDSLKHSPTKLTYLLAAFIFFYIGLVTFSISFFSLHTPLDWRILSPVFVATLVLLVTQVHTLIRLQNRTLTLKILAVATSVALAGYYIKNSSALVADFHQNGSGYSGKGWVKSELIHKVRALPSGTLIYTNGPDAIYILTGRPAYWIPLKKILRNRKTNKNYLTELKNMEERLKTQRGVLVYFYRQRGRWYLPLEEELEAKLPLVLRYQGAYGKIYAVQYEKSQL